MMCLILIILSFILGMIFMDYLYFKKFNPTLTINHYFIYIKQTFKVLINYIKKVLKWFIF
jgi:hypothetical protein